MGLSGQHEHCSSSYKSWAQVSESSAGCWYWLACLMVFVSDSQLYGCWLTPCKMLRVLCHKMSRHSSLFHTLYVSSLLFFWSKNDADRSDQRREYWCRKTAFVWKSALEGGGPEFWPWVLGTVHKHMRGTKSMALGRNPNCYGYKTLSLKIYSLLALRTFRLLFTASELLFSLSQIPR